MKSKLIIFMVSTLLCCIFSGMIPERKTGTDELRIAKVAGLWVKYYLEPPNGKGLRIDTHAEDFFIQSERPDTIDMKDIELYRKKADKDVYLYWKYDSGIFFCAYPSSYSKQTWDMPDRFEGAKLLKQKGTWFRAVACTFETYTLTVGTRDFNNRPCISQYKNNWNKDSVQVYLFYKVLDRKPRLK